MKSLTINTLAVIVIAASGVTFAQTPPATVDANLWAAKVAAGTDWAGVFIRLCIPPPAAPQAPAAAAGTAARVIPARETWYAEPAKVTDNLYFLGTKYVSSWAIVGSEGIIVIESLWDYAVKDEILDGLKKVGLDPNKVKYVILSHAHPDHDGGSKMLQDTIPGVHLIYGAGDWDGIEKMDIHLGGKPKRDMVGEDGMKVSVGDASVQIVTMPGHTEGTLSYLFEVRDNGKPLRVAYIGGEVFPFNADAAYYERFLASSRKMGKAAADYGATVLMTNHSEYDNALYKAHFAAHRKPGEANPFELGANSVTRYFTVVQSCAIAARIRSTGR